MVIVRTDPHVVALLTRSRVNSPCVCCYRRYSDRFADGDGDGCKDLVLLDDLQNANVLANIQANFAAASSSGQNVVTLSQNPTLLTPQVVRLVVTSPLPAATVKEITARTIGVGSEFLDVNLQTRRRQLSVGVWKTWTVTLSMSGLLSKLLSDTDFDGIANQDDSCPFDPENDADGDALCTLAFCFDDLFIVDPQCGDYRMGGRLEGLCQSAGMCTTCACSCAEECTGESGAGDMCPAEPSNDADSDNLCAGEDECPFDATNDADSDNLCGETTSCVESAEEVTSFGKCEDYAEGARYFGFCELDGVCDACPCSCFVECGNANDVCPLDAENDVDSDGVCGSEDSCPYDADNDIDGDGLCSSVDSCPADPENDQDADGLCSFADSCPWDRENDVDGDGFCGDVDPCPVSATGDTDNDGFCDDVDSCPFDADNDADADGTCGNDDPCPQDSTDACNQTDSGVVVDGASDVALLNDETLIIVVAVVCAVVLLALIIVVVVVIVNRRRADSVKRIYETRLPSPGAFGANAFDARSGMVDNSKLPSSDRAESVVSTEGLEVPAQEGKVKKHKTKPTSSKDRKTRKKRDSKSSGSTATGEKWTPDPNKLSSDEWEQALTIFFKK